MNIKFILLTAVVITGMITTQTFAATVNNFSFEETSVSNDVAWISPVGSGSTNLYGWLWTTGSGIQCGTCPENNATWAPFPAADGNIFGHMWYPNQQIAQTISGLIPGNTYPIAWAAAGRPTNAGGTLWVLMDGTLIANYVVDNTAGFISTNVDFTATAISHQLRFFYPNIPAGIWAKSIFIDDVQIIPEPATLGLLAILGLAFLRRK